MMADAAVLVTDGGPGSSRSALATVRALGAAGHRSIVTMSGQRELAATSRYATSHVDVPPARNTEEYRRAIHELIEDRGITTVFATSDDALIALDPVAAEFVDKSALPPLLERHGIPTAPTQVFESAQAILSATLDGPVVVKPVTGSTPAVRFEPGADAGVLQSFDGALIVQPFLTGTMESISGVVWNGLLRAVVHQRYERTWPIECGTSSSAVTIEPNHNREEQLTALLSEHRGIFQAQFLAGALIDVNPRPYGSMPLALQAGLNLPNIVCELGSEDTRSSHPQRAKVGVRYRWIEGDVRSVIGSMRSGSTGATRALASLLPRAGTAHSLFAMNDPRPVFTRGAAIVQSFREGRDQ
jgi:predicted ATP-grasp superfamily ATP-dependent carboligase